nr:unnamed protein product [Callosobruchus analis]CAI5847548.1 unnamed protein product [Callosobruchus analis]
MIRTLVTSLTITSAVRTPLRRIPHPQD